MVPGTEAPPIPATATVNVPGAVMVAGSITSLKVADILSFVGTSVAPEAGMVESMVGAVRLTVLLVVKLQTTLLAKSLPNALCAAVLMVAVYCVLGSKFAVGANVAVLVAAT